MLNGALAAEATGGVWTGNAPDFFFVNRHPRDQTRTVVLALKGERFDAHDHVEQAVALGEARSLWPKVCSPHVRSWSFLTPELLWGNWRPPTGRGGLVSPPPSRARAGKPPPNVS